MKKPTLPLVFSSLWLALAITMSACPPSGSEGEGEGEGEGEEGEGEGEGDPGEGEGEGDPGEGEGEGDPGVNVCTTDAQCEATEHCQTIFSGGANGCYAGCETQGGSCTTKTGATGQCQRFGTDLPLICFSESADLEPCGNAANAACANATSYCVTLGDIAATPQDEGNFSFCASACNDTTPCATGACSDDAQFTVGGGATYGICGPVSSTSTVCGASATSLGVCTGDFSCAVASGQNTGTCVEDAGEGEGEGEGE